MAMPAEITYVYFFAPVYTVKKPRYQVLHFRDGRTYEFDGRRVFADLESCYLSRLTKQVSTILFSLPATELRYLVRFDMGSEPYA